jgi:sugar-specific transcriptional regulator TrmB/DNA-binding CsgD family transcriptional regulator
VLEAVGLAGVEEQAYVALLGLGEATEDELVAEVGLSAAAVRRAVRGLADLGLVTKTSARPRRLVPAQPDIALEALVISQQQRLERVRLAGSELLESFNKGRSRSTAHNPVELVVGPEAVRQRYLQLQASAREQVRILDRPPYVVANQVNAVELDALARGVRYRVLYDSSSFDHPGKSAWMRMCVAAGEDARMLASLPCKINIADSRVALSYDMTATAVTSAVVVHPSSLLDSLLALFEELWSRAQPVSQPSGPSPLPERTSEILRLLAAGVKDETIARQLGLHLRTVRRDVATAMTELQAKNRVQLGVQAARRGWI